jgi:hypothetical protein
MNEPVYEVKIDDKTRAVAYYDNHAESPREWAEDIYVQRIVINRHYLAPYGGTNDLGDDIVEKQEGIVDDEQFREEVAALMAENKRAFRIVDMMSDRDYVGTFIYYGAEETISQETIDYHIREMKAFYNGKVYQVCCEKLVTYTSEAGTTIDRWEIDGDVWGQVYFTDGTIEEEMLRIAGEIEGNA